jgi:hypothetical protein
LCRVRDEVAAGRTSQPADVVAAVTADIQAAGGRVDYVQVSAVSSSAAMPRVIHVIPGWMDGWMHEWVGGWWMDEK